MKNKKTLVFVGAIIVIILIIIGWITGVTGKKEQTIEIPKPAPISVSKSLSDQDLPAIAIEISSDRSGAVLMISEIADRFSELEYELIYTAESNEGLPVERGVAGGPIKIDSSRKVSETVLFGTESCTTGTCKRHIDKNVSGGMLAVRLVNDSGEAWGHEVKFTIEKTTKGYGAVFE
jgi:hypothetical protein